MITKQKVAVQTEPHQVIRMELKEQDLKNDWMRRGRRKRYKMKSDGRRELKGRELCAMESKSLSEAEKEEASVAAR
jgi:hypothetical protein